MNIQGYTPIPDSLTVPEQRWKEVVTESIQKYGVKWNYNRITRSNDEEASPQAAESSTVPAKRKRLTAPKPYIWFVDYVCHRNGTKRDRVAEGYCVKGGASGKARDLQKASKKISCSAKLKVTCYKNDPTNVVSTHIGEHNHEVGGLEDMKHLPLSVNTKNMIEERLREGYAKRDTRISIQNNFRAYVLSTMVNGSSIIHRDQMIHGDEIYNLYKKIQEKFYKLAESQHESVKLWLERLTQEKSYSTFLGTDFEENYSFGFVSPWQKQLSISASSICLDATHCVTNIDKGLLYTIVVRHPNTGTGCPVAFFYTKDHSSDPLIEFLIFLKDLGLHNPTKVTIDVSHVELLALHAVYPDTAVQWCLFHVGRAWYEKIKEYIKCTSFHVAFYVIITIV